MTAALGCSFACGGSYSAPPASPSPAPAPGGPATAVTIPAGAAGLANRAFAPDDLAIAPGTVVTWTNTDSIAHTSTSDSGAWNSGTVAAGGRYSVTFDTPGTFPYHCSIHPGMIGTVVVR